MTNATICQHRNGTYHCSKQDGHDGPHRSWWRSHTQVGTAEWTDDYGPLTFRQRSITSV